MAEKLQNIHGTTTIMVVDNHKLPHFLGNSELLSHVKTITIFALFLKRFFASQYFLLKR